MGAPTLNGLQGISHIDGVAVVDSDGDYHPDFMDDYPNDNAAAFDTDGDGLPNDWLPGKFSSSVDSSLMVDTDDDGDGALDWEDDLPLDASETVDTDGDGIGNNTDSDDDGDGVEDVLDAFPLDVAASVDDDQDGAPDAWNDGATEAQITASELSLDAFPGDGSETIDTDGDGTGNNADLDDDNDTYLDTDDDFPLDATEWLDTDGDGIGNNADPNDDNDAIPDENDAFPLDPTEVADRDGDGIGNNSDPDLDGDGVDNELDAFPYTPGEWADSDEDGIGDNADADDDNDSVPDTEDAFPLDASESADTDGDGVGDNDDIDSALALITDSNFNACLAELGVDRVSEVTSLSCRSREIGSLQGIGVLSALTELDLTSNSSLNDFTVLAELPSLRSLALEAIPLAGNTSLSALTLESLNVAQANLSSLEGFLPDPAVLRELILSRNSISDLSALSEYSKLRRLDIQGNSGVIASFPSTLALLSDLNVIDTGVTAISEVPNYLAESLERIYIRSSDANEPVDLTGLDFFTRLNYLNATYSYVDWMSAEGFDSTGLELHATGSYFSSLHQLGPAFEKTRALIVDRSYLTDLNGIEVMTDLELFAARHALISDISAIDKSIEKLYLDDNEITDISSLSELYVDVFSGELSLTGNPIRKIGDTLRDWRTPRLDLSRTDVSCEEIAYVESYLTPQISVIWPENCISDPDRDYFYGDEDAFPNDSAASVDTDNDGAPDAWNEGATQEQIGASDLALDAFPEDPAETADSDGDGVGDNGDVYPNDASRTVVPVSEIAIEGTVLNDTTFDVQAASKTFRVEITTSNDDSIDWSRSQIVLENEVKGGFAYMQSTVDGVFELEFTAESPSGPYVLLWTQLVDKDGGSINVNNPEYFGYCCDRYDYGLPRSVLVITGVEYERPLLNEVRFLANATSDELEREITVDFDAQDESGIDWAASRLTLEGPNGYLDVSLGSLTNGNGAGAVTFPADTESGSYTFNRAYIVDGVGNYLELINQGRYANIGYDFGIGRYLYLNPVPGEIENLAIGTQALGTELVGGQALSITYDVSFESRDVQQDYAFGVMTQNAVVSSVSVGGTSASSCNTSTVNRSSESSCQVSVPAGSSPTSITVDLSVGGDGDVGSVVAAVAGQVADFDLTDNKSVLEFTVTYDQDGDGVTDDQDAFPADPAASVDSDDDGAPDSWNVNASEADIDASNLHLDAFPNDAAASIDIDNDGAPDAWNEGATPEQIAASDLILDAFPDDPNESVDADQDGVGANADVDDNDPESDSDNDGLSDSAERQYGSDPLLADSDGDGFSDGEEVSAGSSPTDNDDVPVVEEEDEIGGFPIWIIEVLKLRESASAPQ